VLKVEKLDYRLVVLESVDLLVTKLVVARVVVK
jgi:hypothetical protein